MTLQEHKRTKKVNKAIKINIKRRTVIVNDVLSYHKGLPIPSWIELSLIDICALVLAGNLIINWSKTKRVLLPALTFTYLFYLGIALLSWALNSQNLPMPDPAPVTITILFLNLFTGYIFYDKCSSA